jgi:hypothetical protein
VKTIALAAALTLLAGAAHAASCKAEADGKKLAGAALTSFMKKCESDAKTACEKSATDQKLSGAAKNSHVTKCVKDAVGT